MGLAEVRKKLLRSLSRLDGCSVRLIETQKSNVSVRKHLMI